MNGAQWLLWLDAYRNLSKEIPNFYEKYNAKNSVMVDALDLPGDFIDYGTYPIDESLENLLRALNGPHAATIFKAYRIRKGTKIEEIS